MGGDEGSQNRKGMGGPREGAQRAPGGLINTPGPGGEKARRRAKKAGFRYGKFARCQEKTARGKKNKEFCPRETAI